MGSHDVWQRCKERPDRRQAHGAVHGQCSEEDGLCRRIPVALQLLELSFEPDSSFFLSLLITVKRLSCNGTISVAPGVLGLECLEHDDDWCMTMTVSAGPFS